MKLNSLVCEMLNCNKTFMSEIVLQFPKLSKMNLHLE